MSSHNDKVNDVIRTSGRLIDALDDAFKNLQASSKMPVLRECQTEFANALVTYRDTVLKDVLAYALGSSGEASQSKLGYWLASQGLYLQVDDGIVQRFADEDDKYPVSSVNDMASTGGNIQDRYETPTPSKSSAAAPEQKPKRKVKRIVRRKVTTKKKPAAENDTTQIESSSQVSPLIIHNQLEHNLHRQKGSGYCWCSKLQYRPARDGIDAETGTQPSHISQMLSTILWPDNVILLEETNPPVQEE
ncbi:hypothetical protein BDV25DRAFT_145316 [Aspergillus avenaceus]|uniref:Uncharacterized protein n=1 Tax=Aspergillus avenaceus TaxID=36643 RepID=A0A5N6TEE2_ASPAV|nr:hypothetical protein BDV25DRAFT_145316 [Aspergillus avenaceus]